MKKTLPRVRSMLPITPLTLGPYLSRMVPIGRAATFVATAAVVNIRFSLKEGQNSVKDTSAGVSTLALAHSMFCLSGPAPSPYTGLYTCPP